MPPGDRPAAVAGVAIVLCAILVVAGLMMDALAAIAPPAG